MPAKTELNPRQTPETHARPVVGVWLMIVTPDNRLFVVENLKPKFESQKIPGQWNAPVETYRPGADLGSFRLGTISRAIDEEIGSLAYDPSKVRSLGLIELKGIGYPVFAAPYLIPISSEKNLIYQPNDPDRTNPENGTNPRWVNLDEVTSAQTLQIGEFQVPLYRSPMIEIVENIKAIQNRQKIPFVRSVDRTISRELIDYFERKP